MLNQTIIIGNCGNDPKIFFSPEGVPVASVDVAFASSKKKTSWIRVTAFHKLAELVGKYLHKGARIGVIGILDESRWSDDQGQNHTRYQLLANSIEFIKTDGRGFKEGETTPETINDETPF